MHSVLQEQLEPSCQLINLLRLDLPGAQQLIVDRGWPRYRAGQLLRWLYQKRARSIDEMTDFSHAERRELQQFSTIIRSHTVQTLQANDGTKKLLSRLEDGLIIESVLIPDTGRLTLCISTQVGCTLDCKFCLTGTMGLKRNLHAYEIVDQVLTAQDHIGREGHVTNLVLMGMGEPLANFEAVKEAVACITNSDWGIGISARRMTLSTAGLASRLQDVATLGVNLAISLNATTDAQRDFIMPTANHLHPLGRLLAACRKYPLPGHRRLTFEYVLLSTINDTAEDAKRLIKLLNGIRCKINLIPFNEFSDHSFRRPSDSTVIQFQSILRKAGLNAFIRKSKGREVLGACGQLGEKPRRSSTPFIPLSALG